MSHELMVHGPLECATSCTLCDGEHCWLDEIVPEAEDAEALREFMEDMPTDDKPPAGEPILVCRHCASWAEYPDWWDEDAEFTLVRARPAVSPSRAGAPGGPPS